MRGQLLNIKKILENQKKIRLLRITYRVQIINNYSIQTIKQLKNVNNY